MLKKLNAKLCSSINFEYVRLILLGLVTLILYNAYFCLGSLGGDDAYGYHEITADVMQQNLHGIFPVYVGQSLFNFSGVPMGRAPYYLLLVNLLNFLTFHTLSSLQIQHFTILFSALAAAYVMYFTLTKVVSQLRWTAFAFSIFYITCPGILGLIDILQMYFSLMTLPFLPLLMYALVRQFQKNDAVAYVLLGASLSLLWMSHAAIAFWSTVVCFVFCSLRALSRPSIIPKLILAAMLFITLNLWHFAIVIEMQMGNQYAPTISTVLEYADYVTRMIQNSLPGAFLPIDLTKEATSYLQLGYALWIALLLGVVISIKQRDKLIGLLLASTIPLFMFLFPWPHLNYFLWTHVPTFIRNFTSLWPMERFYIILAALACFVGVCSLNYIYLTKNILVRRTTTALLVLATIWSLYQSYPFLFIANQNRSHEALPSPWLLPENIAFHGDYTSSVYQPTMLPGIYDPALNNKVLDANGKTIPGLDNSQLMAERCLNSKKSSIPILKTTYPTHINFQKTKWVTQELMDLTITPNTKYMLCFNVSYSNVTANFEVAGNRHLTRSMLSTKLSSLQNETLLIPVFTTENFPKNLLVQLTGISPGEGVIHINKYGFVAYDATTLPIKLQSLIPYRISVHNTEKASYLETARQYVPGYVAYVNSKKQAVLRSSTGRAMIPLVVGNNEITLVYKGTPAIRIAFWVSLIAWCGVLIFSGLRLRKQL